jgi:outer membrane protein TolC
MVYYHALYSKSVVKVQEEAIHLLEEELATQKKRLAAGTTTRFGVLRAEVELANAQPDLIKARNDQQTAYIELAKLLAIPYPPNQQDAPFDLDGELEYKPQTFQVQDIITAALKNRPELRVAEKNIEIEKKQVDISRSNYYPHVSGYTGYQLNSDRTKSSLTEMVNGWVAGIQGSWKIFDSDMTKGKIEQNQADLHKAVIDLDETRRDIDAEAREAYLSLQQAEQLIDAQQKTTEQAKEALRLADERYGVGMATQLDVLNARIALTRARTNELEARYNYNIAIADLEKIMAVPLNEISKT